MGRQAEQSLYIHAIHYFVGGSNVISIRISNLLQKTKRKHRPNIEIKTTGFHVRNESITNAIMCAPNQTVPTFPILGYKKAKEIHANQHLLRFKTKIHERNLKYGNKRMNFH